METKVTGSGPMASYSKRGHGSSWTVAPAEDEGSESRKRNLVLMLNSLSRLSLTILVRKGDTPKWRRALSSNPNNA
jgi:hypothetical protein